MRIEFDIVITLAASKNNPDILYARLLSSTDLKAEIMPKQNSRAEAEPTAPPVNVFNLGRLIPKNSLPENLIWSSSRLEKFKKGLNSGISGSIGAIPNIFKKLITHTIEKNKIEIFIDLKGRLFLCWEISIKIIRKKIGIKNCLMITNKYFRSATANINVKKTRIK